MQCIKTTDSRHSQHRVVRIQAVNPEKILLKSHIIDRKSNSLNVSINSLDVNIQKCYSASTLDLLEFNITTSTTLLTFAITMITMHHCITA